MNGIQTAMVVMVILIIAWPYVKEKIPVLHIGG